VDEAHAVGIYGASGSGLIEASGVGRDVLLSINTAGKALGVSGAFVAGPGWAIDYLIQRARPFVFSTAPSPPLADALDASLTVIATEPERRERLSSRVHMTRNRLSRAGLAVSVQGSQIIPIAIGDNGRAVAAALALQADGFDVRAIRPPSVPPGTARLRVSLNAGLSDDAIERFAVSLAAALKEVGLCSAAFS
jgi:8-amino-7-oxononanoate synthase